MEEKRMTQVKKYLTAALSDIKNCDINKVAKELLRYHSPEEIVTGGVSEMFNTARLYAA